MTRRFPWFLSTSRFSSIFLTIFFHRHVTPYIHRFREIWSIDANAINFPHVLYLWQKHRHNRHIRHFLIYSRLWAITLQTQTYQTLQSQISTKATFIFNCIHSFVRNRIQPTMSQSVVLLLWKRNIVNFFWH